MPRCRLAQEKLFTQEYRRKANKEVRLIAQLFQPQTNPEICWHKVSDSLRCEKPSCGAVWMGNDALTQYIKQAQTCQHNKGERVCLGESYLVIIPPLFWLNDKGPNIRNGHLYGALARGLIVRDQVKRRGGRGAHLDLRLRGGGRGKRLQGEWDRKDRGPMEMWGTLNVEKRHSEIL